MGLVTTALVKLLTEHLNHHHVVVWFDPEKAYGSVARTLSKPNAFPDASLVFVAYDPKQGFFSLRRSLEPVWQSNEPPRLLIYVPLASKDTQNALAEYVVVGAHLEPGQPGDFNTRLAIVTRRALENALPGTVLEKILADVEAGKLSLQEIESLADRGQASLMGALSLIFQSASTEDIALQFLTNAEVDRELTSKAAGQALANLLNESLDASLGKGDDLNSLRSALSRHLLTVEFLSSIDEAIPVSLKTIPMPKSPAARQTAVNIVHTWRQRRDLAGSYIASAQKLEAELSLGSLDWNISALQSSETFQRTEISLQMLLEQALIQTKPSQDLLELATQRLGGFWSTVMPEIKLRWQVIIDAARVLLHAQSITQSLKGDFAADILFKRYTASEQPWCMLDTFQRHLERDAHNLDPDPHTGDSTLKLVAAAQRVYAELTDSLTTRFVRTYEKAGFSLKGITQQVEIYHDFVEPAASDSSIAYFLIDGFRYEMARELLTLLPEDWKVELTPALATPPSITEVGMGALMPGAERGISIVPAGASKLGVTIGESTLKNRPDRVRWLEEKGTKPVIVTELNKIAPLKDKHLLANIKNARLIVITASDEIDGLWENQPHMARQLHEHVFEQLRRGLRSLFSLGVSKVIVTADHGFLIGDYLMQGEPQDAPGGETADLHRRVWVGKGGAAFNHCIRKPLSAFGIGGDLELVTPENMTSFKLQGGSNEYFHGGLSLQEITIPVISITEGKARSTLAMPPLTWSMKPGSKKITTRFFTVTVEAQTNTPTLFSALPRVRVEIRAGNQIISVPVSASYGFNEVTRDVSMKYDEDNPGHLVPNAVTLQITDVPELKSVTLYLLDEVGASLASEIKLPLEIAF